MADRDLIMTMVYRIRFESVEPFYRSLKRTGYNGDLVFFATMTDEETKTELARRGIKVISFRFRPRIARRIVYLWPVWRRLFNARISPEKKERLAHAVFPLFYRRHLLYLQFLREHRDQYDRVFITDSRDVYFQAHPFSWNMPPGAHFFLETDSNKIGPCPYHTKWIASQFGREVLAEMAHETISCAGTTFGDIDGMIEYLSTMVSLSMNAFSLRHPDGDQGIHNYILRKKRLSRMTIYDNQRGPVMTVGAMKPEDVHLNAQGLVVNDHGDVPPVLHQYDRIPHAKEALWGRLREAKA